MVELVSDRLVLAFEVIFCFFCLGGWSRKPMCAGCEWLAFVAQVVGYSLASRLFLPSGWLAISNLNGVQVMSIFDSCSVAMAVVRKQEVTVNAKLSFKAPCK